MNRKQRRAERKLSRSTPAAASLGVQNALAEALRHHQAGRLNDAERLYRQILAADPNHTDSLHLLGMIAYQVGFHDQAVDLIGRAIRGKPTVSYYHGNLGLALSAKGDLVAAITCYRQALMLQPDYVEAHSNLGNALKHQGKLAEAVACYRRALALKPDLVEAHNNLGNALKDQGNLDEAIASYRKALALRPDYAEAHGNLGNALRDQRKLDEAIACYRQALAIGPDIAEAHNNLGNALKDQGHLDEAEACYRRALELKPAFVDALNNIALLQSLRGDAVAAAQTINRSLQIKETPRAKRIFVDCIKGYRLANKDRAIEAALARALTEPWCRPSKLATVAAQVIALDPKIGPCLARAAEAWPRLPAQDLFGANALDALAAHGVLRALLCSTPICSIELEWFLTMARRVMLDAALEMSASGTEAATEFCSALAQQCFINEYVFCHADGEIEKANDLRDSLVAALDAGDPIPPSRLLAAACYFPLFSLPQPTRLLDRQWPEPVVAVLAQQLREPAIEMQLRAAIPRLTGVRDEVSRHVRDQYEENPYPRWVKTEPVEKPRTIAEYLHQQFPLASLTGASGDETIDVLIAGCGTGQQSIGMAQLIKGARILAVDLSLNSLSYAKRKTKESGLTSVEYAQTDLLELGSLGRQFDVIASVGVLHHLADPLAGWRILLSLLRPGGFMNLGLYSQVARRDIVKAQAACAAWGFGPTADEIRRCRQRLMDAEQRANFATVIGLYDFYSVSTCRDLLFHVQEHQMTLGDIDAFLRENGLAFLGFEIGRHVIEAYKQRFPGDPAAVALTSWQEFENDNPHTFTGMYQFWVQKNG